METEKPPKRSLSGIRLVSGRFRSCSELKRSEPTAAAHQPVPVRVTCRASGRMPCRRADSGSVSPRMTCRATAQLCLSFHFAGWWRTRVAGSPLPMSTQPRSGSPAATFRIGQLLCGAVALTATSLRGPRANSTNSRRQCAAWRSTRTGAPLATVPTRRALAGPEAACHAAARAQAAAFARSGVAQETAPLAGLRCRLAAVVGFCDIHRRCQNGVLRRRDGGLCLREARER